ncbi:MAG: CDP-alcohol phosphatidyltransferase family protein [Eubacteriales bacterium]
MTKKSIVNSLTFLRILCSVLFGILVLKSADPDGSPLIILLVIFASDIMDGKLARRWNVTTRRGAIFDVTADMFFVAVSFVALILRGVFPPWLLAVAALKFIEFGVTSSILTGEIQGKSRQPALVFDKLGRFSAILLMAFPFPALLIHQYLPAAGDIPVLVPACLITVIAAVSSGYRLQKCALLHQKPVKTMR